MAECSNCDSGAGPFAEVRELVEFVSTVHDGTLKDQPIPEGGLDTKCQGCGERFILKSFVGKCPECAGVHAVSPPVVEMPPISSLPVWVISLNSNSSESMGLMLSYYSGSVNVGGERILVKFCNCLTHPLYVFNPQISQTRLPPARNASQGEAGGLQGTSGQVTLITIN